MIVDDVQQGIGLQPGDSLNISHLESKGVGPKESTMQFTTIVWLFVFTAVIGEYTFLFEKTTNLKLLRFVQIDC